MALYPSYSSIPYDSMSMTPVHKTLITIFEKEGQRKAKRKWLFPKRKIELTYRLLTKANARTLWLFFNDRNGQYESFNFFHHQTNTYEGELIGIGDGTTTSFNIPGKTISAYDIYIDGVEKTEVTHYSITADAGTDGADKLDFVSAPEAGAYISTDFTGYLKVHCRFGSDELQSLLRHRDFEDISVELVGENNE